MNARDVAELLRDRTRTTANCLLRDPRRSVITCTHNMSKVVRLATIARGGGHKRHINCPRTCLATPLSGLPTVNPARHVHHAWTAVETRLDHARRIVGQGRGGAGKVRLLRQLRGGGRRRRVLRHVVACLRRDRRWKRRCIPTSGQRDGRWERECDVWRWRWKAWRWRQRRCLHLPAARRRRVIARRRRVIARRERRQRMMRRARKVAPGRQWRARSGWWRRARRRQRRRPQARGRGRRRRRCWHLRCDIHLIHHRLSRTR
jgi:hypothetical protein